MVGIRLPAPCSQEQTVQIECLLNPLTARKRSIARSATIGEFDGRRFLLESSRCIYARRCSVDRSCQFGGLSPHHPSRKLWTNRPYVLRVPSARPLTVPRYESNSLRNRTAVVIDGKSVSGHSLPRNSAGCVIVFSLPATMAGRKSSGHYANLCRLVDLAQPRVSTAVSRFPPPRFSYSSGVGNREYQKLRVLLNPGHASTWSSDGYGGYLQQRASVRSAESPSSPREYVYGPTGRDSIPPHNRNAMILAKIIEWYKCAPDTCDRIRARQSNAPTPRSTAWRR